MSETKNGRLDLDGTEHSQCNRTMALDFKGLTANGSSIAYSLSVNGLWRKVCVCCWLTAKFVTVVRRPAIRDLARSCEIPRELLMSRAATALIGRIMCRITAGRGMRAGTDAVHGNVTGIRQWSPCAPYDVVSFTHFTTFALDSLVFVLSFACVCLTRRPLEWVRLVQFFPTKL